MEARMLLKVPARSFPFKEVERPTEEGPSERLDPTYPWDADKLMGGGEGPCVQMVKMANKPGKNGDPC